MAGLVKCYFLFFHPLVSPAVSGGRAQLSKQIGPVRLGGGGLCHWPDSLPGTWKSSSSSPRPPHPSLRHSHPYLSWSLFCSEGSGSFPLGFEQREGWWTLALPIPHALNSPRTCISSAHPSQGRAGCGTGRVSWFYKPCTRHPACCNPVFMIVSGKEPDLKLLPLLFGKRGEKSPLAEGPDVWVGF